MCSDVSSGCSSPQIPGPHVVGAEATDWVFTNSAGRPIHPHSISQTFERIVKRAGVPRIRLHDVRHAHGTFLIKAGMPVKVVSERLGHGNPAFNIDTYQHVPPRHAIRSGADVRESDRPGGLYRLTPVEPPVEGRKRSTPLRENTPGICGCPKGSLRSGGRI